MNKTVIWLINIKLEITLNLLTPHDSDITKFFFWIYVFKTFKKPLMNSYPKVRCPCNTCWRLGRSGKNRVLKHIEPLEKPSCFRRPWTWKIRVTFPFPVSDSSLIGKLFVKLQHFTKKLWTKISWNCCEPWL